ncbi:MAG: hypothetical protein O3B31_11570 [Chloroflexi bacterium]|nr:hypothetical protein [Chloroflexota bacterium]
MLASLNHNGHERHYGLWFPVDLWTDWGEIPALLVFHGGGGNVGAFMATTQISSLMAGAMHGGVPQRFVAVFPAGISFQQEIGGGWRGGHMGRSMPASLNDVDFAIRCLERANEMLARKVEEVTGTRPAGTFYANAPRFAVGFSAGGQMAYRVAAEGGQHGFHPTAIGVVATTAGGWSYATVDPLGGGAPNSSLDALQQWAPPAAPLPPLSVLHIHGNNDNNIPAEGGVSRDSIAATRLQGVVVQAEPAFRRDLPAGPAINLTLPVPTVGTEVGTGLEPWIAAVAPGVVPVAGPSTRVSAAGAHEVTWATAGVPPQVTYVLVPAMVHEWPHGGGAAGTPTGYQAMSVIWDFLQDVS